MPKGSWVKYLTNELCPLARGKSENYRALANLAENPKGKTRDFPKAWSRAYAILLRSRQEGVVGPGWSGIGCHVHGKRTCNESVAVVSALARTHLLVTMDLGGLQHSVGPVRDLGERVVAGTFENIDKYAKESMHLMQGRRRLQVRMRDPDDVLAFKRNSHPDEPAPVSAGQPSI